ncbi:hypothetical protein [Chishuiella sp.]|uniref:hypothetical protein n=1 Tax=Chishuiella sp. TaxID=1969467 RepID=UPI0028ABEC0D|nr:hypothetical protein [Chishuiella sp.]
MDNYSFEIFVPEKKKKSSKGIAKVIISFLIVTVVSFICLELEIFKNQTYYYIFIGILATLVAYFNGYFKKPSTELLGTSDGKITFEKKGITIKDEFFPIKDIYSIIIDNDDYKGKKIKEFGEFETEKGSNGVSNLFTLKTKNNKFIEAYFKQNSLNEFQKIENILIDYYKSNLLSEDDLISILNYKSDIDKIELKKKLK